ncbi:hypothetical protein RJ639_014343 [Escallonia herrerae]|uniref:TIR domain-containing protein n=1 Tax=Escallonia herrerae TaxID=1293975 RepID=A0AA88VFB7_9ASTE|nr:hypothetical protein RJ639_014343 [Escallonia herrerae]
MSMTARKTATPKVNVEEPNYDVFLHFGGKKIPKFIESLFEALVNAGFRTFQGGSDLQRAENSNLKLEEAMRRSRSSLIFFSRDDDYSMWCLDLLLKILEEKRTKTHVVLPVFYYLTPAEVSTQKGLFQHDFEMYRRRFEEDTVDSWRLALKEAAALAGMDNSNVADYRKEQEFIRTIIEEISSKLILEETKATEDAEPSSIKRDALIYYPNKPPDRNKYTRRVQKVSGGKVVEENAISLKEQLATMSRAIEKLTKTVEKKDLQIVNLMNKLESKKGEESKSGDMDDADEALKQANTNEHPDASTSGKYKIKETKSIFVASLSI